MHHASTTCRVPTCKFAFSPFYISYGISCFIAFSCIVMHCSLCVMLLVLYWCQEGIWLSNSSQNQYEVDNNSQSLDRGRQYNPGIDNISLWYSILQGQYGNMTNICNISSLSILSGIINRLGTTWRQHQQLLVDLGTDQEGATAVRPSVTQIYVP